MKWDKYLETIILNLVSTFIYVFGGKFLKVLNIKQTITLSISPDMFTVIVCLMVLVLTIICLLIVLLVIFALFYLFTNKISYL